MAGETVAMTKIEIHNCLRFIMSFLSTGCSSLLARDHADILCILIPCHSNFIEHCGLSFGEVNSLDRVIRKTLGVSAAWAVRRSNRGIDGRLNVAMQAQPHPHPGDVVG